MPEFNTEKCTNFSSFINDLNAINSSTDVDKVDKWMKNNWAYLQKGYSENNQDIRSFEARLQNLAENDTNAKRILETFTNYLTNISYFEIAPADILRHTAGFLGSAGRRKLYDSHISEKTDAMIENTMVMDLNKGLNARLLGLSHKDLKSLLEKHKTSIKNLNLSGFTKNEAVELALLCPNLTALNLYDCYLDLEALNKILNAKILSSVQILNLSQNRLGADGVRALLASETFKQVRKLNLSYNNIAEGGARALAASKLLSQVLSLNLAGNKIGDEGVRVLAESDNLTQVQSLNLFYNQIGVEGARVLAASEKFPQIKSLNLASNKIRDEGARALAESKHLAQIPLLNLSDTQISAEEKVRLENDFKDRIII